jgi:hypothetical protein
VLPLGVQSCGFRLLGLVALFALLPLALAPLWFVCAAVGAVLACAVRLLFCVGCALRCSAFAASLYYNNIMKIMPFYAILCHLMPFYNTLCHILALVY